MPYSRPKVLRVYFIQSALGAIKIGCTHDVKKRLSALQTGSPHRLTLLADVPGSSAQEAALHEQFRHHRMSGEWFHPVKELTDLIEAVVDGARLDVLLDFNAPSESARSEVGP